MTEIIDSLAKKTYTISHPRRQVSTPNEPAAINRVHIEREDLTRLKEIDRHPKILKWMTGGVSSEEELIEWARDEMLFAIRGKKSGPLHHAGEIIGFVNTYLLGPTLKKRLSNEGLINEKQVKHPIYEIAYAINPDARYQNGLVSSAVRLVIAQISAMQNEIDFSKGKLDAQSIRPQATFIAFVNPENTESITVLKKTGFVKTFKPVKYHGNSKEEDDVYVLNWKKHSKLLRQGSKSPVSPEAPGL